MKKTVRRYKAAVFDGVDLVDRGANFDKVTGDGAHIMLSKRDTSDIGDPTSLLARLRAMLAKRFNTTVTDEGLRDALAHENLEIVTPTKTEPPMPAAAAEVTLEDVQKKIDEALTKAADAAKVAQAEAVSKAVADAKVATDAEITALKKRADDSDAAAKAAAEVAKAERDLREVAKFEEVCKGLTRAGVTAADAVVLKRLHDLAPTKEDVERVMVLLKAAEAQLATSALFAESGNAGRASAGSAEAEIMAKAAALIAADPKLDKDDAVAKVLDTDRPLANRYTIEKRDAVMGRRAAE